MLVLYAVLLVLEHGVLGLHVVDLIIQDDELVLLVLQLIELLLEHGDEGVTLHGIGLLEGSATVHLSRYKDNSKKGIIGCLSELQAVLAQQQEGECDAEGDGKAEAEVVAAEELGLDLLA